MSTIGQRVFVLGGNQLYMTLANEEFVRPLGIGTNWSRIRVGVMFAATPDGVNNIANCNLFFGLCSGTTAPYGSASCQNAIGADYVDGTLTYNANSGNPYFTAPGLSWAKKVSGVVTTSWTGMGPTTICTNTGTVQRRSMLMFDVAKGSPNFSVAAFWVPTTGFGVDYSFANFLDIMEQSVSPTVKGISFTGSALGPLSYSEAAGSLDTLDLYWNRASFPMEIYGIAAYRIN